jgi:putative Holliday junction resolvase
MRILGLDIGDKRIGISLSDELLLTAQSHKVLERRETISDIRSIKEIVDSYDVTDVVIGMPFNMDGSKGFKADGVEKFTETFKKYVDVPVHHEDERLTTAQAHRSMLEGDLSRNKRKKRVDAIAAQLILQTYLDRKRIMRGTDQGGA